MPAQGHLLRSLIQQVLFMSVPRTVLWHLLLKSDSKGAGGRHGWDWVSNQASATPASTTPLTRTPATRYTWFSRQDLAQGPVKAGFLNLGTSDILGQIAR